MTTMTTISIRQTDGTRYLAVRASDAQRVSGDPTLIDTIRSYACLDVDRQGRRTWERPARCDDTPEGRTGILAALERSS